MRHDTLFDAAGLTKILAVWSSIGALAGGRQAESDGAEVRPLRRGRRDDGGDGDAHAGRLHGRRPGGSPPPLPLARLTEAAGSHLGANLLPKPTPHHAKPIQTNALTCVNTKQAGVDPARASFGTKGSCAQIPLESGFCVSRFASRTRPAACRPSTPWSRSRRGPAPTPGPAPAAVPRRCPSRSCSVMSWSSPADPQWEHLQPLLGARAEPRLPARPARSRPRRAGDRRAGGVRALQPVPAARCCRCGCACAGPPGVTRRTLRFRGTIVEDARWGPGPPCR